MAKTLQLKKGLKGIGTVCTEAPTTYVRKEGGIFHINDQLSQRDMNYLKNVMGLDYFEEAPEKKKTAKADKKEDL